MPVSNFSSQDAFHHFSVYVLVTSAVDADSGKSSGGEVGFIADC